MVVGWLTIVLLVGIPMTATAAGSARSTGAVIIVGLTVLLGTRAARVRLVVGREEIVIVNLWRSRHLAWDDIEAIDQGEGPSLRSIGHPIRAVTFHTRGRRRGFRAGATATYLVNARRQLIAFLEDAARLRGVTVALDSDRPGC